MTNHSEMGINMQSQSKITLNKTLIIGMIFAYSVILLLLICMDWYLIETYQSNKRAQEEDFVQVYASKISEDLKRINDTLYDVYEYDSNFRALSGNLSEVETYDNVYELDYGMRGRIFLEEQLHGYILYYSANENVRYYFDSEIVPTTDISFIKKVASNRIEADSTNWKWFSFETNGNRYAMLIGKKENVSLGMVYSIAKIEQNIKSDMPFEGTVFLIDREEAGDNSSDLLYSKVLEQISAHKKWYEGTLGDSYIYANRIDNTNLWICLEIPIKITRYLNVQQVALLLVTLCSMIGAVWLYRYMKKEMVMPLRNLIYTMNRIKDGDWDATTSDNCRLEEICRVNETMEKMVAEIKKQRMLSYEYTIEKQQTQLRYLQLQLKPHFYLNGLKILNVLAMNGETEKIQDLIMNLSYHLRYLLQVEKELGMLESEISYVKNYEKLQQNMTGRPFLIEWKVQADVYAWQVPIFCIETFVENSFKHAKLGDAQKMLLIQISICELNTENDRFLDICVRDNGAGYDEEVLKEINDRAALESKGIGINNIKRRCALLYGEKAEYGFYNENGAVSELIIPWQQEGMHTNEYITG